MTADVIRLQKGHTQGLEPNSADALISLALQPEGGKIARRSWSPPAG